MEHITITKQGRYCICPKSAFTANKRNIKLGVIKYCDEYEVKKLCVDKTHDHTHLAFAKLFCQFIVCVSFYILKIVFTKSKEH